MPSGFRSSVICRDQIEYLKYHLHHFSGNSLQSLLCYIFYLSLYYPKLMHYKRKKEGYETILGNGGQKLSGGERQKIAVSRALLKKAKIVLLDEATTGYDMESRKVSMKELFPNQTVIVVTHHQEELEGMDTIYRLHQGEIEKLNRGGGK